jgi:predicted MFS family arabinose efflux permease
MTSTLSIPTAAPRARRLLPASVAFVAGAATLASLFLAAGAPNPLLPHYEQAWGFAPWLLTLAFGVYAIALLAALLVVGRLSDHIGRRPLLIASVAIQLAAMVVFLLAPSVEWLLVARVLQGISVGTGAGAFGAAIVELAPEHRKRLGGIIVSAAAAAGLAIGSLFGGAISQLAPQPALTLWTVLIVIAALGTVIAALTPETATRKAGALRSLVPRIAVPHQLRRVFAASIAVNTAAWMTGALFLGLFPTVLRDVFQIDSPLLGGVGGLVAFGAGTAVSLLTGRMNAHRLMLLGSASAVIGAAAFVVSVVLGAFPLVWVAALFGGAAFGAGFGGTIRSLIPSAHPHERAGLFAAIYVVSYLALGVPAIVAGLFIAPVGATAVAAVYGLVVAIASAVGIAAQAVILTRSRRSA